MPSVTDETGHGGVVSSGEEGSNVGSNSSVAEFASASNLEDEVSIEGNDVLDLTKDLVGSARSIQPPSFDSSKNEPYGIWKTKWMGFVSVKMIGSAMDKDEMQKRLPKTQTSTPTSVRSKNALYTNNVAMAYLIQALKSNDDINTSPYLCLLYTSPSPRDS